MPDDRLRSAIAAIDDANAGDPVTIVVRGATRPKEQAHAELMTEWVQRLDPGADEAQLLAARAHHLRRWSVPRASYPDGRAGYLQWRTASNRRQAEEVATILASAGYDTATIERVQRLVRKEGLRTDPAAQTHEDALCLTFLETQLDDLVARLGDEKAVDVLAKTLRKMSAPAVDMARTLPFDARARGVVENAMAVAEKP